MTLHPEETELLIRPHAAGLIALVDEMSALQKDNGNQVSLTSLTNAAIEARKARAQLTNFCGEAEQTHVAK